MIDSITHLGRIRKSFGKSKSVAPLPYLIEVQKNSYARFLQDGVAEDKRDNTGLHGVYNSIFPVQDFSGKAQLEYVGYTLEKPRYSFKESQYKGLTYASLIKVTFRLIVWDIDEETKEKSIRDIKEQIVNLGDIPLMTDNGTFLINGVERVVVSQMHRSPGAFFDHDGGKTQVSGKYLFSARLIPYRGSWIDFEFDSKDILYVRIDKKKKILATTLLMSLSRNQYEQELGNKETKQEMDSEFILNFFYDSYLCTYNKAKKRWVVPFDRGFWKNHILEYDLVNADDGKVLLKEKEKITPRLLNQTLKTVKNIFVDESYLIGRFIAKDLIDESTGEVILKCGDEVTSELLKSVKAKDNSSFSVLNIDKKTKGSYLRNTLFLDKNKSRNSALKEIYRILRPGEPPTVESGKKLLENLFFDPTRYDLSAVGRVKLNLRLNRKVDDKIGVLQVSDIFYIVKTLLDIKDGQGEVDDIDNLANRRVRSVGELLENQYRIGLLRMEKSIRERMGSLDIDAIMPNDLINSKTIIAVVKEFFGLSQLSQFMDQTNPLAEVTHKRRLSALGPGGLTRDRAGFEVRDVHPTHYGRICPIETPEGPNIGLINSFATYSRINQYGFIETPYRKVDSMRVTDEIIYLSAYEEWNSKIGQAGLELDKDEKIKEDFVPCRFAGEALSLSRSEIQYVDVSPCQLVSVAASLIPFLENDDANRALMGSNMQRQAVPLMYPKAPFVGTGMEEVVSADSGSNIVCKHDGVVHQVDARQIVVRHQDKNSIDSLNIDIYNLKKFQRSNQNTCLNQKVLVKKGDIVKKGDVIADGTASESGELALGQNVLVSFLSWEGYNFEDSIIVSERIVRDDVFTSIHIEEFETIARDTKLGNEEITRDIPGANEESLRNLDESGIIIEGVEAKPGDILVGKVTPRGESPVSPEEKLLRAIFGEKATDVRDSSLKMPSSLKGTIVGVKIFSRKGIEKDERSISLERMEIDRAIREREAEISIIEESAKIMLINLLEGQICSSSFDKIKKGEVLQKSVLNNLSWSVTKKIKISDNKVKKELEELKKVVDQKIAFIKKKFEEEIEKLQEGDDLPAGILKVVKIYVAVKRKLQSGDKMAGRHGNKGVVSCIRPVEDMPFLEDGTPVDIILNPLGIPSRMNVGQIMETHLGWACAGLGKQISHLLKLIEKKQEGSQDSLRLLMESIHSNDTKKIKSLSDRDLNNVAKNSSNGLHISTPVFDGATEKDIDNLFQKAGLDLSGQESLYDGKTGERYERKVTVGYMYILKLHHLVDEKIHARSVGPYSLVTQQPLGGKAQTGGQRFGEMEVWALQAYGAAYTLQEMLTIKSDDVAGRTRVYEAIIKGDTDFESGIPESFNVLVKELRSLCLNINNS